MMKNGASAPLIVWFRNDLRLSDNPALHAAVEAGAPLICLYIHEHAHGDLRPPQGAALWWLHGSLAALEHSLKKHGGALHILAGNATEIVEMLVEKTGARGVYRNRRYDQAGRDIDERIKVMLREKGLETASFNGSLLHEPWTVQTKSGSPFKVFTPYWSEVLKRGEPAKPLPAPTGMSFASMPREVTQRFAYETGLETDPQKPDWASRMREFWERGEDGGQARLHAFVDDEMAGYADGRDQLDRHGTSRLSPYLRFGNVSVRQVWHALSARLHGGAHHAAGRDIEKFKSELGWREFCYSLLYHCEPIQRINIQGSFDAMEWSRSSAALKAWQQSRTGYPIVDAAMRELWHTGTMHNRARMIVGSFLVKHLLIDWREGEAWFWDTLVDADPANNPANWQWVAGTGADAAPYFRILNPILQGEKFDTDGGYVKRWVPELAELPVKFIHRPWAASKAQLLAAGVRLGETYPHPIVDHDQARKRALATWRRMRGRD